jgi:TPR repeat protein
MKKIWGIRVRKTRCLIGFGLAVVCGLALGGFAARAQQDAGPVLRPRTNPKPAASATLLVMCDLDCDWRLDGKAQGRIAAGDSATARVDIGEHMVVAATEDGLDKTQQLAEVKKAGQKVVNFELQPLRAARLKTEREADPEAAEKAAREAVQLKDRRDRAAESAKEGKTLYDLNRFAEAKPLFEKACDGGDLPGCVQLGELYESGYGVTQDHSQARMFFQKACDGKEMLGCTRLGFLYQFGLGVDKDPSQARMLVQKACDAGEMEGCTSLGVQYEYGFGVSQDFAHARVLYQQACDRGQMKGCTGVGILYQDGKGVTQDYGKARVLYQKACSGGAGYGCQMLGALYEGGLGVTQDRAQARVFYQKACDGGYGIGCESLHKLD